MASANAAKYPCGEASCGSAAILPGAKYSQQIQPTGQFSAELTLEQRCSCTRHMGLVVAFTAIGATTTQEHAIKVSLPPGKSTRSIVISNAELAAAKVTPGRYNVTFALFDERERPTGQPLAGNPFMFGNSKESLEIRPVLPDQIAAKDDLPITFLFANDGDAAARVTALVVFTRPGTEHSVEYYVSSLLVPPGGAKHVVRVSAAQRRKLGVGLGAWLVGTSGFDAAGTRMASYPGNPVSIGKPLSFPAAAEVSTPIAETDDLTVKFTMKNEGDAATNITALLVFTQKGEAKAIEFERNDVHVMPGSSTHSIVLGPRDREQLGLKAGRFRVAVSGFDAAGKRLDTVRATREVVIGAARASR